MSLNDRFDFRQKRPNRPPGVKGLFCPFTPALRILANLAAFRKLPQQAYPFPCFCGLIEKPEMPSTKLQGACQWRQNEATGSQSFRYGVRIPSSLVFGNDPGERKASL